MRHTVRLKAGSDAKYLVHRRQSCPALGDAILDHRAHPFAACDPLEFCGFCFRSDGRSYRRRDLHDLEQALASAKAGGTAPFAALRTMHDLAGFESKNRKAPIAVDFGGGEPTGHLAVLTQHAHEAL